MFRQVSLNDGMTNTLLSQSLGWVCSLSMRRSLQPRVFYAVHLTVCIIHVIGPSLQREDISVNNSRTRLAHFLFLQCMQWKNYVQDYIKDIITAINRFKNKDQVLKLLPFTIWMNKQPILHGKQTALEKPDISFLQRLIFLSLFSDWQCHSSFEVVSPKASFMTL